MKSKRYLKAVKSMSVDELIAEWEYHWGWLSTPPMDQIADTIEWQVQEDWYQTGKTWSIRDICNKASHPWPSVSALA